MSDITAYILSEEILQIVNNDIFTFRDVVGNLDKGLSDISYQVFLPSLQASSNVTTVEDVNITTLPADYQRCLSFCYNITQNKAVRIFNNKSDVLRYFGNPALTGSILGVAVFGLSLYYQKIPTVIETLQIDYYKKHPTVTSETDTFTCLPANLTRHLLVNFVCAQLFSMVEQGNQDARNNTLYHLKQYQEALALLKNAYPIQKHRG